MYCIFLDNNFTSIVFFRLSVKIFPKFESLVEPLYIGKGRSVGIEFSQVLRSTTKFHPFYRKSGKAGQAGKIYQFRGKFYQQKF